MRRHIQFLILIFFCFQLSAQNLKFDKIDMDKPELKATVLALLQDLDGFIWIATTDGLKKYDGLKVTTYRNIPHDTTSLSHNFIRALHLGKDGKIWIGTRQGLNVYDPATEAFSQYLSEGTDEFASSNLILDIQEDSEGFIWYTTYNGIFRLQPEDGESMHFLPNPENPNSIHDKTVWDVHEDLKGRLWFATNKGIAIIKDKTDIAFEQVYNSIQNDDINLNGQFWAFEEQPDGTMWVGSDNGLYSIFDQNGSFLFQNFAHDPKDINSISDDYIDHIYADGQDKLWVSTLKGGLNEIIIDRDAQTIDFVHHSSDPNKEHSLRYNQVHGVMKDNGGILWVATQTGLNIAQPIVSKFENLKHDPAINTSLNNSIIKAITKDLNGNLWVGTISGLNFLHAADLRDRNYNFKRINHVTGDKNSLSHDNIFGLFVDQHNVLWVSTRNGLNYAHLNNQNDRLVFKSLGSDDGLPHSWVYDVTEIDTNNYWVTTYGGLSQMTIHPLQNEAPVFINYEMNPESNNAIVNSMCFNAELDQSGNFWISTYLGLSKFNYNDGTSNFENFLYNRHDPTGLSDNSVVDIHSDILGRTWIGTRNGLNLVVKDSITDAISFRSFGIDNGFINSVIQSIEEDDSGKLWLGTNGGLVHFDPEKAITDGNGLIKNYTVQDGLSGPGQVFRASYKSKDGYMFFGSAGGLNIFHPDSIRFNIHQPKIAFTQLKILNESISPNSKSNNVLSTAINETKLIHLNYRQNMIRLEYAALDFANPEHNNYMYKLEGFNDEWIDGGNDNFAVYTNLNPGKYTFKVKGSNNDLVWSDEYKSVDIIVLPPPWKSWWAYSIYITLIILLIYAWMKARINVQIRKVKEEARLEKARLKERDTIRKKNAKDFHDELGHRLTKIGLLLNLAERNIEENHQSIPFLTKVKSHTSALSEGIKDLIWSLDPGKDSLKDTLFRLQEFGDQLFTFTDIAFKTFDLQEIDDHIKLNLDKRKHILLVFKEAMNNSLKYSGATNATLTASITDVDNNYEVKFCDDGIGFNTSEIKRGYGLKNMKDRADKINGSITINSSPDKGTCIALTLPVSENSEIPHSGD